MTQETYTVVIEKRHCENTFFSDVRDCAVCKAIKEAYPELKDKDILDNPISLYIDYVGYDSHPFFGYGEFEAVKYGALKSFPITFTLKKQNKDQKPERSVATDDAILTNPDYKNISHELAILPQEEVSDLKKQIIYE